MVKNSCMQQLKNKNTRSDFHSDKKQGIKDNGIKIAERKQAELMSATYVTEYRIVYGTRVL